MQTRGNRRRWMTGTRLAVCGVEGVRFANTPRYSRGIVVLRFCVFVLAVVGSACGAEVRGEDRTVCSEDAECASSCKAFARVEAAELQATVCAATRCSCGLSNDDGCLATGGVIGREEVSCPADDAVVRAAADEAMTLTPGANDA